MRNRLSPLAAGLVTLALPFAGAAEETTVRAADALEYLGERVTVCGRVVDASYFPHLSGEPTYLNLESPYPNPTFSVVIWGQYRSAFRQSPDRFYQDKEICITGVVQQFRTWPQIVVKSQDMIRVMDPGLDADRFTPEERAVIRGVLVALGHAAEDPGEWTPAMDQALAAYQGDRGLPDDPEAWPQTLRALAEDASGLTGEQSVGILRLLLLHLAQRETELSGR
ncbi:MAG: hypothetical protein HKN12_10065 [Gemmatimonadetes bacterium]|nr:hypothetical protein [Gemmatimonadota bacterium]